MKSPKNWIIVALASALALSIVMGGVAQTRGGVTVELLVWQDTTDPERHYVTTRLAGESWQAQEAVAVALDRETSSGRWRYGKHTFELAVVATCSTGIAVPDPTENKELVDDCEHLLKLRDGLSLDQSFETPVFLAPPVNWSADRSISSWTGVTVGGTPPRVTKLRLQELEMYGVLPSLSGSLTGLKELTELHLSGNDIEGLIPSGFEQFTNLTHLYLAGNRLTGCVPPALRAVPNNDLAALGLPDCAPPIEFDWRGVVLATGTYQHASGYTFDVPPLPEGWTLRVEYFEPEPAPFMRFTVEADGLYEFVDVQRGAEIDRLSTDWLLDHIVESMWWDGP